MKKIIVSIFLAAVWLEAPGAVAGPVEPCVVGRVVVAMPQIDQRDVLITCASNGPSQRIETGTSARPEFAVSNAEFDRCLQFALLSKAFPSQYEFSFRTEGVGNMLKKVIGCNIETSN